MIYIYITQEKIVPPDPITPSEKKRTLERLNQVIQYRLVSCELPTQMRKLSIGKCLLLLLEGLCLYLLIYDQIVRSQFCTVQAGWKNDLGFNILFIVFHSCQAVQG